MTAGVEKRALLAGAAALALLAALFPLAWVLDQREDRQRPMYRDVLTMAWLQYDHLRRGGEVVPVELQGGESTTVDGQRFTASRGVTVSVETSRAGYCVRGRNEHGDVTPRQCGDAGTRPPPLGALASLD